MLEVRDRAMDVTVLLAPSLKWKAEFTSVISLKLIWNSFLSIPLKALGAKKVAI